MPDGDATFGSSAAAVADPAAPAAFAPERPQATPGPVSAAALSAVQLRLAAEVGSTVLRVEELLRLRPGSVVRLDQPAAGPVDITVEGRRFGAGEVIVIDDVLALRVTEAAHDPEGSER